jgi:hypothetical protein
MRVAFNFDLITRGLFDAEFSEAPSRSERLLPRESSEKRFNILRWCMLEAFSRSGSHQRTLAKEKPTRACREKIRDGCYN